MLNLTRNGDSTGCTVAADARNNLAWDAVAQSSRGCNRTQHNNGSGIEGCSNEGCSNSDRYVGNSRNACTNTSANNVWVQNNHRTNTGRLV